MTRRSENPMRVLTILAAAVALAGSSLAQSTSGGHDSQDAVRAIVALDNARVRAYRTTAGVLTGVDHGGGVVVWLGEGTTGKAGRAIWLDDVAVPPPEGGGSEEIVIVQPLERAGPRTS